MIKIKINRNISNAAIVFSAFVFLCPNCPAQAKPQLPFCPPVSDQKQTPAPKLEPINLENVHSDTSQNQNEKLESKAQANGNANQNSTLRKFQPAQSTFQKAQNINCVPLPLTCSQTELDERRKIQLDAQQKQLTELWTATIERSQDIQFVIEALQPKTDKKHAVANGMKLVGNTIFTVGNVLAPASPFNQAMPIGAPMIAKLFSPGTNGAPEISVGETMVLYKVIRDIADKLVNDYRNYKCVMAERDAAMTDLNELREIAGKMDHEGTPAQIMQLHYTLSKAERDATLSEDRVELCRQKLIDLAGTTALEKLDSDIDTERLALQNLIGRPNIGMPLSAPETESAAGPHKSYTGN